MSKGIRARALIEQPAREAGISWTRAYNYLWNSGSLWWDEHDHPHLVGESREAIVNELRAADARDRLA